MTDVTLIELADFIRGQGNIHDLTVYGGSDFLHWSRHDKIDRNGRPIGAPRNHVRIVVQDRMQAVRLLRARTFETREGVHFLLDAHVVASPTDGCDVFHISGLRAGLRKLHREKCYAARLGDGSYVYSASPDGVRRKMIRNQSMLSKESMAVDIGPEGQSSATSRLATAA